MKYLLEVKENPEYGGNGLIIKNIGRAHFEPLNGQVIAHDIIEHPVKAHPNCYVDEFMALGAIVGGRIENGYFTGYRYMGFGDIEAEVTQLAVSHFHSGYMDLVLPCNFRLRSDDLEITDQIRSAVRKGLSSVSNEIGERYDFTDQTVSYITGWICKGYSLFKKRFQGLQIYDICNHLFDTIKEECDFFLKSAEIGDQAILNVTFSRYHCELEQIGYDHVYGDVK
jgi:hypothetical protein